MTLGALVVQTRTLAPDARSRVSEAGRQELKVTGITHDSRAVSAGVVFVAIRGQRADGATFAASAAGRGAAAVVAETPAPAGINVPWIQTPDARLALAELSAIFYGRPSEALTVVGVTGTNGKTTSTYLLAPPTSATRHIRHQKHQKFSACYAKWPIEGVKPARWKCRRTHWYCVASPVCGLQRPSSRI
jgi:hypothetical protein